MQPTPLKSMRATVGRAAGANTRSIRSRTTRPVGRVTRSVYTADEDSCSTAGRRYAGSPLRGPLLRYDDEHLRTREIGQPFRSGTSSSQLGTIAMRAVPLRMAIFPSHRAR